MSRGIGSFVCCFAALGCAESTPDDSGAEGLNDLTETYPAPPEDGFQLETPDVELQPGEEAILCYYGRYTGETVGVTFMQPFSVSGFSHHNQLKAVAEDDPANDGDLLDCTLTGDMSAYAPLFQAVGVIPSPEAASEDWIDLPEGYAMKLVSNQRWVLDFHYINTSDQPILVNNAVNVGYIPESDVTSWVSAIEFDDGGPVLPPASESESRFTCNFLEDFDVLSLLGHMHKRGLRYLMEFEHNGEPPVPVYDVTDWVGSYDPFYPVLITFAPGEFPVKAGDGITTTCSWFNETDETLTFPEEMCTSAVVVAPMEYPMSCYAGEYKETDGSSP